MFENTVTIIDPQASVQKVVSTHSTETEAWQAFGKMVFEPRQTVHAIIGKTVRKDEK